MPIYTIEEACAYIEHYDRTTSDKSAEIDRADGIKDFNEESCLIIAQKIPRTNKPWWMWFAFKIKHEERRDQWIIFPLTNAHIEGLKKAIVIFEQYDHENDKMARQQEHQEIGNAYLSE